MRLYHFVQELSKFPIATASPCIASIERFSPTFTSLFWHFLTQAVLSHSLHSTSVILPMTHCSCMFLGIHPSKVIIIPRDIIKRFLFTPEVQI
mmetsp:Transcript_32229/g.68204  ORF Transcript_32229/g.68204 Transcript_32229/m.68204 type:complete len:93 (+) Transcript_32229:1008-1286(+)